MNVKSPNNTSKWQMGFNSVFKGLILLVPHGHTEHVRLFQVAVCICHTWDYQPQVK